MAKHSKGRRVATLKLICSSFLLAASSSAPIEVTAQTGPGGEIAHSGLMPGDLVRIYEAAFQSRNFVIASSDESTAPDGMWTATRKFTFTRVGQDGAEVVELRFTGKAGEACSPCLVSRQSWRPGGIPGSQAWTERYEQLATLEASALNTVKVSLGRSLPAVSPTAPPTAALGLP
ncbi:hypothetical protein L2Y94_01485 [Luteibacter aegosomatis]|uniref:hypothetical protein n=1 Tax=Luteibacter aegosomatis TaxID=2911537 RepID=UPI001FF92506|nr:hypothetical protein [Luteibacter aegosomatis]UPG86061.1 hypothetical protein L2Y94_01485 [Luteibacter aegosomatis]